MTAHAGIPIVDLGGGDDAIDPDGIDAIAAAAESDGFFQIVGHGIPNDLIDDVWHATRAFFALDRTTKRRLLRTKENTRGYYDRELTKNRRDLKEVLDIAQVPFPDLAEDHPRNRHAVDGQNQWPPIDGFRDALTGWLVSCETVSHRLLTAFCSALGESPDHLRHHFQPVHTSFVRLNHYPLADPLAPEEAEAVTALGDMALHHHTDAGALTLLLQDEVGGLQVAVDDAWIDVPPVDGAIVVNTGDMMQVWSNDRFRAAMHRVRPVTDRPRLSLPYFFNPSYDTEYAPLPGAVATDRRPNYRPINWGAFRQGRADGDFADYGAEIQIADFRIDH